MTHSKADIINLITGRRDDILNFGVTRFGVFGSFVRDEANANSDVDILVEFEPGQKTFRNFSRLADYLEELFNRPVDLLTPEALSPYIGPRILEETEYVSLN